MSIAQALQQSGAIDSMARELGVDKETAQSAAGALLPAIVAGLGRNHVGAAENAGGSGLGNILGRLADGGSGTSGLGSVGGALLNQVLHKDPTPTGPGNDILGQIFGSKDVSRGVADEVAGSTGLSSGLVKKMLPMLAMAVVGYIMKQHGTSAGSEHAGVGGAAGGILGQIVGGILGR